VQILAALGSASLVGAGEVQLFQVFGVNKANYRKWLSEPADFASPPENITVGYTRSASALFNALQPHLL
jgi:hypothetical protein